MTLSLRAYVLEVGQSLGMLCHARLKDDAAMDCKVMLGTDMVDYAKAIADLLLGLWHIACSVEVHIQSCVEQKMILNRAKYRPDDCSGDVATKYTAYTSSTGISASNQEINITHQIQNLDSFIGGLDMLSLEAFEFAVERDWIKFDTRCNLIMSLSVEYGELCAIIQFHNDDSILSATQVNKMAQEIADVCIYALRLAKKVGCLEEVKHCLALHTVDSD